MSRFVGRNKTVQAVAQDGCFRHRMSLSETPFLVFLVPTRCVGMQCQRAALCNRMRRIPYGVLTLFCSGIVWVIV
jgi:hypothetical protein